MSTETVSHDAHAHDHDHGPQKGFMRWITTTNHKDIGTMYLVFALIMFFVGGSMALIIRAELFVPGLQLVDPQFFNSMTTVHALVMTVLGALLVLQELGDGLDVLGPVAVCDQDRVAGIDDHQVARVGDVVR